MANIPSCRFDITGASGSQGLLGPKDSWRAYVLERGGNASQDSTGTLITFDTAAIASRFAVSDWIQAGLLTANIRQVGSVGGNSINVSGAALTVTENQRIFIVGVTEPTLMGNSATYYPSTTIRQRGDDSADTYTNSMVTTNSDGLVQFYAAPAMYDVIVQDGNQSNQGYIADLEVGTVEGVSVIDAAYFGSTVTFNGPVVFGVTVTFLSGLSTTTIAVGTLTGSTVYALALGVSTFNSTRYINRYATSGTGTSTSMWTGWESAVLEGWQNYFPAGFYGTTTGLSLALAANNQPGRTSIVGDGFQSSSIVGTSDVIILRVYGTQGSPTTQQCTIDSIDVCTNVTNTQASGMVSFEGGDTYWSIKDLSIRNRNAENTTSLAVTKALQFLNCQNGVVYNPMIRSMTEASTPISTGLHITADDANQRGNITVVGGMINNALIGIRVNTTGSNSLNNNSFINTKLVLSNTVVGSTAVFLDSQADQQSFNNLHIEKYHTAYALVGSGPDSIQINGGLVSGASYGVVITAADGVVISAPRMATVTYGVSIGGAARNVYWFQGRMDSVTTPWTNQSTSASNMPVRINGGRWIEDVYLLGRQDPTPNVAQGSKFITGNTGATVLNNFINGISSQSIWVVFGDTFTTVDFTGTALKGNSGVDWLATPNDSMQCLLVGTTWFCSIAEG